MLHRMLGCVYQSNTHALGPLPGKAHPTPRVLTIDALKANAADALGMYNTSVAVGLCGHHHLQYTVSAPPAMGPLRCWLLSPSISPFSIPPVSFC